MSDALRLLFYDDTCRRSRLGLGLTHSWIAGAHLWASIGKFHGALGVRDWRDALEWLATWGGDRPIEEVQYWGHGKWGRVLIDGVSMTTEFLQSDHEFRPLMERIRDRMAGPDALWWFRTCETFGADSGHDFARRWTDFFECRAAGHTYIIGPLQSGLHTLRPGVAPDWTGFEGIAEGTPDAPKKALWSVPGAPNTISCLRADLPSWSENTTDSA